LNSLDFVNAASAKLATCFHQFIYEVRFSDVVMLGFHSILTRCESNHHLLSSYLIFNISIILLGNNDKVKCFIRDFLS